MPTEAEWEYACRAGSTTRYSSGDDDRGLVMVGNVTNGTAPAEESDRPRIAARDGHVHTAPVGRFRPNDFGLYDMHGNVWEWCSDEFGLQLAAVQRPGGPFRGAAADDTWRELGRRASPLPFGGFRLGPAELPVLRRGLSPGPCAPRSLISSPRMECETGGALRGDPVCRSGRERSSLMDLNRLDVSAKELVWDDPAAWVDRFGIGPPGPVSVIDSEITTLTASADKVLKVNGPAPYLLNLEPHSYHDTELARKLWYRQVALDYRHDLPVLTVLILLPRRPTRPA